jgi:hypothetical protein
VNGTERRSSGSLIAERRNSKVILHWPKAAVRAGLLSRFLAPELSAGLRPTAGLPLEVAVKEQIVEYWVNRSPVRDHLRAIVSCFAGRLLQEVHCAC